MHTFKYLVLVMLTACLPGLSSAFVAYAESPFSAGAARVEITPDLRMTNWVGHKPYTGVLDRIFARALVLAAGTNRVALLCWDLVDAREGVVKRVRQAIARKTGLASSQVFVHASHTHSAPWSPMMDDGLLKADRSSFGPVLRDPVYQAWAEALIELSVQVVERAEMARKPATLAIARACVGEIMFNRRPRKPDGKVETIYEPENPYVLPHGMRFGPLDPTLALLAIRDAEGKAIATLFNLPCHPVTIYPYDKGISADWPGPVSARLQETLGGEALFLQGCAGDIVPARRGIEARMKMASLISDRALAAVKQAHPLTTGRLRVASTLVELPLTDAARRDLGKETFRAEVQVVTLDGLALVGLPGEPLSGLATAIQDRSPFPHTLVLGYSNGYGTGYVGLPGDKARGGYEMSAAGAGTDVCGQLLIEAAVRLLRE